ncbi:MAG: hypothetical protein Rubg2KO_10370 [Rubricoccaceae bacterium]
MRFPLLLLAFGLAACERPEPVDTPLVFDGEGAFIDDGAENSSFAVFRDTLRAIVARQDTAAFLQMVAAKAQLSYDDAPDGPDGLRALWFSNETSPPEPLWTVFNRLLAAGSVEEDGAFTLPFVAGLWPEDLDPFAHVAAVGDSTIARHQPGGSEVARLSGVLILPLSDNTNSDTWHVVLPDGSIAYIPRTSAVSPVGYRATFWQDDGDWKLQVFVSGD